MVKRTGYCPLAFRETGVPLDNLDVESPRPLDPPFLRFLDYKPRQRSIFRLIERSSWYSDRRRDHTW